MNTLVVFLISMIFLLTVLIKFKWSASVGLVLATILMGLLSGMQVGELTGFISGGFGNTMTSTGLVIIFGCIFGEMLGSSGALEESRNSCCARLAPSMITSRSICWATWCPSPFISGRPTSCFRRF